MQINKYLIVMQLPLVENIKCPSHLNNYDQTKKMEASSLQEILSPIHH